MARSLRLVGFVLGATAALAGPGAEEAGTEDRLLFPRHAVRGFAEFSAVVTRGGSDLGRCSTNPALAGDGAFSCAAFSRYALGGYFEIQPLGRKLGHLPLNRLFLFTEPRAFFGQNMPPWHYTASAEPIMWERVLGLGVELPENLEFRLLRHENYWFGRYRGRLGDADLGPNGPYGLYAALSLRWFFGGWGRWRASGRARPSWHLVSGFMEFEVNPSHAERDLGRCTSYAGAFGGANAACSAFARYGASGYLELRPLGRKRAPLPLQRLFLLMEPKTYFGRNVPQFRYSASIEPILLEWSAGMGARLAEGFELRFQRHGDQWLGRHRGYLGPADMGGTGPYGKYTTVSLGWNFGGWNRQP